MHDDIVSQESPYHLHTEDRTRKDSVVIKNARTATEKEHKMTLLQGIKVYPKAVFWSVLILTCICMEGYDVCLLSNFCESIKARTLIPLT